MATDGDFIDMAIATKGGSVKADPATTLVLSGDKHRKHYSHIPSSSRIGLSSNLGRICFTHDGRLECN